MSIRDYLSREARRITDNSLAGLTDAAAWKHQEPERRRQYREMMGLGDEMVRKRRPPVNVHVTGSVERPTYRVEKLYYESLPKLYVTANLYLPAGTSKRSDSAKLAGVLYVCGHAEKQKVHYQAHPRRFAELGIACLIVETVQLGEARGYHHGCYREGWFHWISRGYSPASIETINGIRGLDLLAQRPEVNPSQLGVTGISGGGAVTWWIAAADERVKAAAPVCGTSTLASYVGDRTLDGHCDCMWLNNTYRWDLADVGAIVAPRPLLIASADRDPLFSIESIRETHRRLESLYTKLGVPDRIRLIQTPGGHSYHERSRTAIFSWFAKHLQGREVAAERIGDIDESPERRESEETLRVFVNGPLKENRTPTIHDELFTPPTLPLVADTAALRTVREHTVAELRRHAFGAFPVDPPPLAATVDYEWADNGSFGSRFSFLSEEGWRLHGQTTRPAVATLPAPVIVALCGPDEERGSAARLVSTIHAPWIKAVIEPRGTGDTAWGQELQWHLRRACYWTGRTLAGMRVWDTLRALDAVRRLPGVDRNQVSLAARGEMAAVALYAALLDGSVRTLFLESPPATQNVASRPDGRGDAIEMINCLQITDLPQVAGLLFPAELVIAGDFPASYVVAEALYERLAAAGKIHRVTDFGAWSPG